MVNRCPELLRRRYHDGKVIPFVGAGVSMSVSGGGGPSWSELVERAALDLGFSTPDLARVRGTDLQILEYYKHKHSGHIAKITNWLVKRMALSDEDLSHSSTLSSLAQLERCRVFYTTNYDDYLERALRLAHRSVHVVAVESEMGSAAADVEVVKFHGDWDHPSKIVLTESDYESRLRLEDPLDLRLRSDLLGRTLLFVGYSFRDPNVSYLFRLFTDGRALDGGISGPRAYIIVADPSDFEYTLYSSRGIDVIPVSGLDLTAETADVLQQLRS
jgi:hypothetical protein